MDEAERKLEESTSVITNRSRGVSNPRIELGDDGSLVIGLEREAAEDRRVRTAGDSVRISLESIKADIHNQTSGLIDASTGCIPEPGGPGC